LVEDNVEMALSLSSLLRDSNELKLGSVCHSAEQFLTKLAEGGEKPDILLVDLALAGMSGQQLIGLLRNDIPSISCVAHTIFEDRATVLEALRVGAAGYLVKGCTGTELIRGLLTIDAGGAPLTPRIARMLMSEFQEIEMSPLSPREQEVLDRLGEGSSYKECAEALTVSVHTVHSHVKKIYEKLEVNSKSQAVEKARRQGWL
jgi:two-component system NarL family response regulator